MFGVKFGKELVEKDIKGLTCKQLRFALLSVLEDGNICTAVEKAKTY